MAPKKRSFPCGHRGKGQFCHRCQQEERKRAQHERDRLARWSERKTVEREWGLATDDLPRHVIRKTTDVLRSLRDEADLARFDAERMRFDRDCISIRLSRDYRLLLRLDGEQGIRPVKVVPHEEYNALIRNAALKGWR